MPITPEYRWRQAPASLQVTVQLPGLTRAKTDVFATDVFLKVNAPPYLLTLDLSHEVDSRQSGAVVTTGKVVFKLRKVVPQLWDSLKVEGLSPKDALQRRKASIEAAHQRTNAAAKARVEQRNAQKKQATERQIALEKRKRQAIEHAKQSELRDARQQLQVWQEGLEGEEETDDDDVAQPKEPTQSPNASRNKENQPPPVSPASDALTDASDASEVPLPPPPREAALPVPVTFTRLETDYLPAREKREKEIRDYKRKNRLPPTAGRMIGGDPAGGGDSDDQDAGLADTQPLFLKDKGDALFQRGDIFGAITAYRRALQIDPDFVSAAMNCSLCYLRTEQWELCEEEAGEVAKKLCRKLERREGELDPEQVATTRRQVGKVLLRRAAARARQGNLDAAGQDVEEAARYLPNAPEVDAARAEMQRARLPSDIHTLQQTAGSRFRDKDYTGAIDAYSALLCSYPEATLPAARAHVGIATCLVKLQRFHDAAQQCLDAFAHLAAGIEAATTRPDAGNASCHEGQETQPQSGDIPPKSGSCPRMRGVLAPKSAEVANNTKSGSSREHAVSAIADGAADEPDTMPVCEVGDACGAGDQDPEQRGGETRVSVPRCGMIPTAGRGGVEQFQRGTEELNGIAVPTGPSPPGYSQRQGPGQEGEQSCVRGSFASLTPPWEDAAVGLGDEVRCVMMLVRDHTGSGKDLVEAATARGSTQPLGQNCPEVCSTRLSIASEEGTALAQNLPPITLGALRGNTAKIGPPGVPPELVETVGKLLVRQGIALAHLREYRRAVGSYLTAAYVFRLMGRGEDASRLEADAAVLKKKAP